MDVEEEGRGLSLIDMMDKEERQEGPQQEPQVGVNRKETRGWRERIQSLVRQKKIQIGRSNRINQLDTMSKS